MNFVDPSTGMKQENKQNVEPPFSDAPYTGNIWGWKWSWISLILILIFMGIAVCRYIVIQPERLIIPEKVEEFG